MSWTRYFVGPRGVVVTVGMAAVVLVLGWVVTRGSKEAAVEGASIQAVKPEIVEFVEPEYPVEAQRRGLEGDVAVKVLVGPKGEVLEAEVVKGVDPLLDEAALEAARRSRWTPGSQRGTPVKAWMLLPYRFELK